MLNLLTKKKLYRFVLRITKDIFNGNKNKNPQHRNIHPHTQKKGEIDYIASLFGCLAVGVYNMV